MRAPKQLPAGIKVRPGRRWPQLQRAVFDDRLLGQDWTWDFDEDEDDTLVIRYDLLHVA